MTGESIDDDFELKLATAKSLRIDVATAAALPLAPYMFRLMMAANDIASLGSIMTAIEKDKTNWDVNVLDGVVGYLLRLQQAHLSEAFAAFIDNRAGGNEEAYQFIQNAGHLQNSFDVLHNCLRTDEHFKGLAHLRNTFTFHYNDAKDAKATQAALKLLVAAMQQDLDLADRASIKLSGAKPIEKRYSCADQLVNVYWRDIYGLPAVLKDEDAEALRKYKDFTTLSGFMFMTFANSTVTHWLYVNRLITPIDDGPQGVCNGLE